MLAGLEDLKLEFWLRQRNNEKIYWTTKNGDNISINRLSDKHLINTIKMLERQEEASIQHDEEWEALSSIGDTEFI